MITKIVGSKPFRSSHKGLNCSFSPRNVFGKPTKPRCFQPSMYQILAWNNNSQVQEQQQVQQFTSNRKDQGQQLGSLRKVMGCKSLPSEEFIRSKQNHNYTYNPNLQDHNSQFPTQEQLKVHNTNNQTDYSSRIPKKSQSLKKITNNTKSIESQKKIYTSNTQSKSHNLKKFSKYNQIKVSTEQREPLKMTKLKKKTIPAYVDPEYKPRYMQEKKSAVQKLIESQEFDQEKFQKIKQEEIKRFKQTSRDLSNSAFLTYFNRTPFENYGRQNKHSSGVLYGDYMYSHNVYPHTGENHPKKQQTYITALSRAKSAGNIRPQPPMTRHLEEKLINGYLSLSQIYPKDNQLGSIPIKNQTRLDNLPMFNYVKEDENYRKHGHASENEGIYLMQDQYTKKYDIPQYFSNKGQIEGKEITYSSKINQSKKS